ncbi:MAG: DNA repair and recombination protein RadA [Candidatus Jordarchaeales archaeon]
MRGGVLELREIKGVGPETLRKLMDAGYTTVESVAFASPQDLASDAGIGEATARRIVEQARRLVASGEGKGGRLVQILPGREARRILSSIERVTTGLRGLDSILGGGVETCAITEFYGPARAGKTQLCHQLCVTVQLPRERGGLEGRALYIDTERTVRYDAIARIAERFGLDPDSACDNVFYTYAVNSEALRETIRGLDGVVKQGAVKLVVVDCLTGHFRAEYTGRETLALRQQLINRMIHDLLRLALSYDLAVVVTNQVHAQPDVWGKSEAPTGGHVVAHGVTYRVGLSVKKGNVRIASLVDAPALPPSSAFFAITDRGLVDVSEEEAKRGD